MHVGMPLLAVMGNANAQEMLRAKAQASSASAAPAAAAAQPPRPQSAASTGARKVVPRALRRTTGGQQLPGTKQLLGS